MNLGKIFGTIGKGVLKGADVAAKAGVPIATQIDQVADAIKDIKGKRKIDEENIGKIIAGLDELKTAIPEVKSQPKALLESNRFKATIIGAVISVGAYYGLPENVATQIGEVVFYLFATYVLADTLRGSTKPAE